MDMKNRRGFSLVEVVLAIGIFSFAIVAIFGLLSVGMRSSKESDNDLAISLMARTVASSLRLEGFSSVLTNAGYVQGGASPKYYFNHEGELAVTNGVPAATALPDSLYSCTVARATPSGLNTTNVIFLQMKFSWPVQAAATNQQSKTVVTSLVNNG
ncbi:hypothetical protein BH09VER1_BH09VER1_07260 [soil metagenome]